MMALMRFGRRTDCACSATSLALVEQVADGWERSRISLPVFRLKDHCHQGSDAAIRTSDYRVRIIEYDGNRCNFLTLAHLAPPASLLVTTINGVKITLHLSELRGACLPLHL